MAARLLRALGQDVQCMCAVQPVLPSPVVRGGGAGRWRIGTMMATPGSATRGQNRRPRRAVEP
jgi:hypothetical protein